MIKFNPRKSKKLSFGYQAENVDPNNLEYYIRLTDGKLDYGIKGETKGEELIFSIPPLNEFVEKNMDELSTIKMEINSKDNKYYLKPFEDSIEIEREPEFNVNVSEEEEEKEKSSFFVTEINEEDKEKSKVSEKDNNKDVTKEVENEVKEGIKKEKEDKKKQRKNKKLVDFLDK